MKFTTSDKDVKEAIEVLDKLINAKSSNALQILKRYKNTNELDLFSSYRLKKELAKISKNI